MQKGKNGNANANKIFISRKSLPKSGPQRAGRKGSN